MVKWHTTIGGGGRGVVVVEEAAKAAVVLLAVHRSAFKAYQHLFHDSIDPLLSEVQSNSYYGTLALHYRNRNVIRPYLTAKKYLWISFVRLHRRLSHWQSALSFDNCSGLCAIENNNSSSNCNYLIMVDFGGWWCRCLVSVASVVIQWRITIFRALGRDELLA